ncbi:hypothetical protein MXB_2443 [Myxobolus squamalis]|nr:hypothetical protein MXB_2443 [Myxobolus squamalis]
MPAKEDIRIIHINTVLKMQEQCKRDNSSSSYKLVGYKWLKEGDENNLVRAIYYLGPISIGIDGDHNDFYYYKSGIIDTVRCSSKKLNHFVLAVGYNLSENPYLLVKNSFGTAWGMDGYFKIALHNNNMCGISSWASFPIIEP